MTTTAETPLLGRLGLGVLDADEHTAPKGRNSNRVGTTDAGHAVFVKRLDPEQPDARARFRRLLRFEATAPTADAALSTPPCLGWDEEELTVVFRWLRDARSGADLAEEEAFTDDLARRAGRAVGALHTLPVPEEADEPPFLPPLEFFDALPARYYAQASGASLDAWRLLQQDDELAFAVRELRRLEAAAPTTAAHCDLRLDQFLWDGDTLWLSDWEEFRRADPARDVGDFMGEWLYRAVLDLPSKELGPSGVAGDFGADEATAHRDVVERGVRELTRLRTRNVAFWAGYRERVPEPDPGLAERATAFAGWHLLDRMLAAAERRPRLSALDRAAAGIGRSALLRPQRFVTTLGLGD
ncbi:class V lanthionine synthetase subunit LxmK [Streptomyces sp. NPDC002888]|uniref:class V lanthionine synthetase subunit LxmK n=1 Tax=Streptomyces sp. NPDC002888 TaxID=3364668 RepID=UPI0036BAE049